MPIPPVELEQLARFTEVKHTMHDILAAMEFDQLIPLPALPNNLATTQACDELYQQYIVTGNGDFIPDAAFTVPKWVFLEYLVKQRTMLLHGSANPDIAIFEPRAAQDNLVGGDTPRVYAASSGVLAGFYAVVDRNRLEELPVIPALNNVYVARVDDQGRLDERFQFALDYRALPHNPWRTGTVYVLDAAPFTPDHSNEQWFSEQPVIPRTKVRLAPAEWPLLDRVRGVDFLALLERSAQSLKGMPWWGDPAIYPAT